MTGVVFDGGGGGGGGEVWIFKILIVSGNVCFPFGACKSAIGICNLLDRSACCI